ncbi:MAG: site-2 protease family protein, partial [Patescibacteria group bacterium]
MSIILLILGLVLFVGLVVVHEFGHFMVARRNGVEVEEFGIGFPPRAWSKKTKEGFIFSLNWLPIGGFVKLKGESDAATEKGSLGAATTWSKTKIMLAGVIMNLVVAFGLLTILSWIGMPRLLNNQFTVASDTKIIKQDVLAGYVESGSPAAKAGIASRDKLLSMAPVANPQDMTRIAQASDLPGITKSLAGEKVTIAYEREGDKRTATTTLRSDKEVEGSKKTDNPKGYLGISPAEYAMARSTWSAP